MFVYILNFDMFHIHSLRANLDWTKRNECMYVCMYIPVWLLIVIMVIMKICVFWYMALCSLVEICWRIRGTFSFYHYAVIYVFVVNKVYCTHFSTFDCVYFAPSELLFPTDIAYEWGDHVIWTGFFFEVSPPATCCQPCWLLI